MDQLSPLFSRFSLSARVFYSGTLCGIDDFDESEGVGHLHLLRRGVVHVSHAKEKAIVVSEPSVIFYPRPSRHRLQVKDRKGAELVCASVDFGAGVGNPLLFALPDVLIIPLADVGELEPVLALLFDEAFGKRCGRQAAVDRLMEYLLILLLRYAIETQLIAGGILAGLAEKRLAKAINAMHEKPEHAWSLEELARKASMSRARFAVNFRETVGTTPLDYLTDWRISVAQTLLKRGQPLKMVAPAVGYGSPVAFTRVFSKRVGVSPVEWLTTRGI